MSYYAYNNKVLSQSAQTKSHKESYYRKTVKNEFIR